MPDEGEIKVRVHRSIEKVVHGDSPSGLRNRARQPGAAFSAWKTESSLNDILCSTQRHDSWRAPGVTTERVDFIGLLPPLG